MKNKLSEYIEYYHKDNNYFVENIYYYNNGWAVEYWKPYIDSYGITADVLYDMFITFDEYDEYLFELRKVKLESL